MGAAQKIIDRKTLQTLVPFNALSPVHFNEVAQKTVVEEVRSGRLVFKEGDRDNQSVYLLEGEINLVSGNEVVGQITAGSDASRHPIAQQQPRQVTARAKTNVTVARIDSSLLDIMLTWDQSSGYEVAEIDDDEDDDWMTRILQSQAFLKLPPSNIQRLLMSVESIPVSAGEVIIRQGGEGDFFYIIKNGRCAVTRKPSANAKEVKLAELGNGDAFGEDALVSDAKRNATVTMMTDGVLMRLAKEDFVALLKEPLLNKLTYAEAEALLKKGAELLDVRLPGEFDNVHIPDSRNVPLSSLRLEADALDRAKKYIVCCDTGRRSSSAAFVLSQRGFEVFVLDDGFGGVPPEALAGNATELVNPSAEPDTTAAVVELKSARDAGRDRDAGSAKSPDAPVAVAPAVVSDELKSQLDEQHALREAAESARAETEQQLADLQDELERVRVTAREQTLELEQDLQDVRRESADAAAEVQRLKDELTALKQGGQAARDEAGVLEAELAERRAQESSLRNELKALQAEKAKLETELERGVQARVTADSELSGLRDRVAELEPLTKKLQDAEAALAEIRARTDQDESAARKQAAELQAELDAKAAAGAKLEARVQELEQALGNERGSAETTVSELQAQLRAQSEKLEQVASERATEQARIADLESQLAAAQQDQAQAIEAADAASAQLRADLEAAATARADADRAREQLGAELEAATARIQQLESDAGAQVKELEAALKDARQSLQASEQDRERLQSGQVAAESELAGLREQLAVLEQSLQSQADQSAGGQARVKELETALTAARADAEQQLTAAREAHEQALAAQQADLAKQLDSLRQAQSSDQAAATDRIAELEQALAAAHAAQAQQADADQAAHAALSEELEALRKTQAATQESADSRIAELEAALGAAEAATQQAGQQQTAALAALEEERDRLKSDLEAASQRLEDLSENQVRAVADQDQAVNELRDALARAEAQAQQADAARAEIEARLAEMSAAASEAREQLEQARKQQAQAVTAAEESVRAKLERQISDLESDLEGARAALAREQSERENIDEAAATQLAEVREQAAQDVERVESKLQDLRDELREASQAKQALEAELTAARAEAESQRQVMSAELEQLRAATTADIEATRKQLAELQDDLQAARKLSKGAPADEELARLRLLLDEAREEARSSRADADQWREQALNSEPDEEATDEFAAMQVQLADIQSRVDDALRLRDAAQEEAAQLRTELQARAAEPVAAAQPLPNYVAEPEMEPRRRGGLWLGLIAGLLVGIGGAGAGLWLTQGGGVATEPAAAAASQSSVAAQPAPPDSRSAAPEPSANQPAAEVPEPAPKLAKPKPALPPVTPAPAPKTLIGREFRDALPDGSQGPLMVEIKAASYAMGSGASSLDFDERPKHDVQLRRFAVGKFEVTFNEFDAFARATGRALPDDKGWGRGDRPVINVNWDDAIAYTRWLSEQTGQVYRLPSEAEWEYLGGGAERSLYWWGNSLGEGRANCFNCGSEWDSKLTAPVGSFGANAFGLHDTAGNVGEWVQDCYKPSYEGAPVDGSAWVTNGCVRRVVRGGGFNSPANTLRMSKRDQQPSNLRSDDLGFRVARDL